VIDNSENEDAKGGSVLNKIGVGYTEDAYIMKRRIKRPKLGHDSVSLNVGSRLFLRNHMSHVTRRMVRARPSMTKIAMTMGSSMVLELLQALEIDMPPPLLLLLPPLLLLLLPPPRFGAMERDIKQVPSR